MDNKTNELKIHMLKLAALIDASESLLPLIGDHAKYGGPPENKVRSDSHDYLEIDKNVYHYLNIDRTKETDRLTTNDIDELMYNCLLYTSPSPRDRQKSRMPSSA